MDNKYDCEGIKEKLKEEIENKPITIDFDVKIDSVDETDGGMLDIVSRSSISLRDGWRKVCFTHSSFPQEVAKNLTKDQICKNVYSVVSIDLKNLVNNSILKYLETWRNDKRLMSIGLLSEDIIKNVLQNILDRKGFRQAWDDTDEDVQKEITKSLEDTTDSRIRNWVK
jgi:hypothetical protein